MNVHHPGRRYDGQQATEDELHRRHGEAGDAAQPGGQGDNTEDGHEQDVCLIGQGSSRGRFRHPELGVVTPGVGGAGCTPAARRLGRVGAGWVS